MNIKLTPYVSFRGNCEEAFKFYTGIFEGSSYEIVQRYDAPEMNAPEAYKDKVLHGSFSFGSDMFFAADVFPGKTGAEGSNIALSFDLADPKEGTELFKKLAEGGEVGVPYQKQFWGDWHGNLKDKFGVRWMINSSDSK